ncbi:MAG: FAD-binding oxidoreductase [Oscillospiraceae bacterium]
MYKTIDEKFVEALTEIFGEGRVLIGSGIGADYGHDEEPGGAVHMPEAVCLAESTAEISALLRLCGEHGIPVTPRGAGTGLVGGSVPLCGGVVLGLGRMNAILGYDDAAMTVRAQSGVLLADLKSDAEKHGCFYAPDPGEKTATIGGNAATNAGGPCAVKYGGTRENVVSATVVLANGEVLELGGTGKTSSGYDLLQLIIGSEGTLGVVTELTLRLHPKAKSEISLILPFDDAANSMAMASAVMSAGMSPKSMEYMDTELVEFSGKVTGNPVFPSEISGEHVAASLLVTFEGKSDDELDEKMEALAELSENFGVLDILVVDTPSLTRDVWGAHDAFHTSVEAAAKASDELNVAVPVGAMSEYVDYVKALGAEAGMGVYAYGHAGDGGLHIYLCGDDKSAFASKLTSVRDSAYARCRELGGRVSSEHGIGSAKKKYLRLAIGDGGVAAMRRIKEALDPKGILNPGKVCTETE